MKKIILGIALIAALFSLTSCLSTTVKEPSSPTDTLVVGRAQITFSGVKMNQGGSDLKGNKKTNTEIRVLDETNGKELILNTDSEGLFMSTQFIPGHSYRLLTFSYNKNFTAGGWAINNCKMEYNPQIDIEEGCVNPWVDIAIVITAGEKENQIRYHWNVYRDRKKEIANTFKTKYCESKWLNYPFAGIDDNEE